MAADACLALARQRKQAEAQACYRARGDALSLELADVVGKLKLEEPSPFGELLLQGKAEMIGVSTLAGAYVAELGALTVLSAGQGAIDPTLGSAFELLAPVVGGAAGLGGSVSVVLLLPQMTAGDANVIRAATLLGAFDSVVVPLDVSVASNGAMNQTSTFAMMGALVVGATAAGAALASATDLPEGAGSMAVSGGLWSSVTAILVADMGQAYKLRPQDAAYLITAAGNLGFVGALAASPFVPLTRAETWGIDVGGGIGLATGASIAVFARAPNPFVGWGTMLAGTVVGVAGGYAAVRFLPSALDALPKLVAVAPLATVDGRSVTYGVALMGRL